MMIANNSYRILQAMTMRVSLATSLFGPGVDGNIPNHRRATMEFEISKTLSASCDGARFAQEFWTWISHGIGSSLPEAENQLT